MIIISSATWWHGLIFSPGCGARQPQEQAKVQHEIGHHGKIRRLGTCLVSHDGCRDQLEGASCPLLLWTCHLSVVSAKTVKVWMISEGTLLLRLHRLDERTKRAPSSWLI